MSIAKCAATTFPSFSVQTWTSGMSNEFPFAVTVPAVRPHWTTFPSASNIALSVSDELVVPIKRNAKFVTPSCPTYSPPHGSAGSWVTTQAGSVRSKSASKSFRSKASYTSRITAMFSMIEGTPGRRTDLASAQRLTTTPRNITDNEGFARRVGEALRWVASCTEAQHSHFDGGRVATGQSGTWQRKLWVEGVASGRGQTGGWHLESGSCDVAAMSRLPGRLGRGVSRNTKPSCGLLWWWQR